MAKHTKKSMRGAIKCHGGKGRMARKLIALMPDTMSTYAEVCVGGGSVWANLSPESHQQSILSDSNRDIVSLWTTIQSKWVLLQNVLKKDTPYEEATFIDARDNWDATDHLGRALRCAVVHRMSRGGLRKDFAWSNRLRGGKPGDQNAWETWVNNDIQRLHHKLKDTTIRWADWETTANMIKNDPLAMIYLDPPYLKETRTHTTSYGDHEWSKEQHATMIDLVREYKCRVMISGYHSELYNSELSQKGWRTNEFSMPNNSGQGKKKNRRTEVVWMNYE